MNILKCSYFFCGVFKGLIMCNKMVMIGVRWGERRGGEGREGKGRREVISKVVFDDF